MRILDGRRTRQDEGKYNSTYRCTCSDAKSDPVDRGRCGASCVPNR